VTSTSLAGDTDESPAVLESVARDSVTSGHAIWTTLTESPADEWAGASRGPGPAWGDSASSHPRSSTTSPAVFKVLLAEDSRANQVAISRLLRAQGVDVTVVDDGSAAVEKLVNEGAEFDLAFFDINMPIMGGVEALRQARAASIDMPIIALTASVERDELRVGAVSYCSPRHSTSCKSRYKGSNALDDVASNICRTLAPGLPRRGLHRRHHQAVAARAVPSTPRATRPHPSAGETQVATHVAAQGGGGGGLPRGAVPRAAASARGPARAPHPVR